MLDIFIKKIPRNYEEEYRIDNYKITESFDKDMKMYTFKIKTGNDVYYQATKHNYISRKEFISNIIPRQNKKTSCLIFETKKFKLLPVCKKNGEDISYTLVDNIPGKTKFKTTKRTYKNIKINTLLNKKIYIWNHTGYHYLNDKQDEEVNFLDSESYYNEYTFKSDNYLITPDLSQKYEFDTLYVVNMKNGKLTKVKLDKTISYNFYYLGTHKNLIYIVDKKNKDEYKVDIRKKTVTSVKDKYDNGMIWDDKWKNISITKLVNDTYKFTDEKVFNYTLDKDKLYYDFYKVDNKIKASDKKIDKIISSDGDEVLYLVKNTLYLFSPEYGEVKILTFNELEFNSNNQVFIY